MQVIKFKIYDKRNRKICNDVKCTIENNTLKIQSIDDYVIMKHTGLKDIYGKEIYEGDIVEIVNDDCHSYPVGSKFEVEFIEGCFMIGMTPLNWDIKNLKVIGNKYLDKKD